MYKELKENDSIEVVFRDGNRIATAVISYDELKDLLLEKSYEIITETECNCSSCSVNNFCECDSVNENMGFSSMFINLEED